LWILLLLFFFFLNNSNSKKRQKNNVRRKRTFSCCAREFGERQNAKKEKARWCNMQEQWKERKSGDSKEGERTQLETALYRGTQPFRERSSSARRTRAICFHAHCTPFPAFDKDVFEHSRRIERPSMRHKAAAVNTNARQEPGKRKES
jgi:hypothetical protein